MSQACQPRRFWPKPDIRTARAKRTEGAARSPVPGPATARHFLLTALTMIAFAANSVLNRMALAGGSIDATSFGTIRLIAGAVMLAALCLALRGGLHLRGPGRVAGVLALLVYMYGFSTAYTVLDAGLGALVLFGVVQITMFAGGLVAREAMPPAAGSAQRWPSPVSPG